MQLLRQGHRERLSVHVARPGVTVAVAASSRPHVLSISMINRLKLFLKKLLKKRQRREGNGLWWLWWLWCGRDGTMVCFSTARIHPISVAEHLEVRLLASPPPRALDKQQRLAIEN